MNPDGVRLGDLAEFLKNRGILPDMGGIIGCVCQIRSRVPRRHSLHDGDL